MSTTDVSHHETDVSEDAPQVSDGHERDRNVMSTDAEGSDHVNSDQLPEPLDQSQGTAEPDITSYFTQGVDNDPFGTIAAADPPLDQGNGGLTVNTSLRQDEGANGRQLSPPVSKDEMTSEDLISIHTASVDISHSTEAEVNRIYDAWIPSDSTGRFLSQYVMSDDSVHLLPDQILHPRLAMADTQPDPVYHETYKLRGESETSKRQVLNLSKVDNNLRGLEQLIRAECWRSALDLTVIMLTNMDQGLQPPPKSSTVITELSMKVWASRIALLTKLKMYSIAEAECQQFSHMESPELYYPFHKEKYPGRTGTLVPFSLRLLSACLPQYLGRHNESLDRLFYIKAQVNKILHNLQNDLCEAGTQTSISHASRQASIALWHQRELQVLYSLGACLVDMKDFQLAIDIYKEILCRDPDNSCFTFSTMGRLCMQMGALAAAEEYFSKSVEVCQEDGQRTRLASLHSGFLALGKGNYKEVPSDFAQFSSSVHPSAVAKNNSAISLLYNGQLKAAIILLEELVHSDPLQYLQDCLLLNLCTLYELESSVALTKKHNLLFLANQYKGNGFNINSLKISPT